MSNEPLTVSETALFSVPSPGWVAGGDVLDLSNMITRSPDVCIKLIVFKLR